MAIEIRETFEVAAPIDEVWRFVMDPNRVVTCMPGAELEKVVDDRHVLGRVKVKLGAITASYSGRIDFTQVDEQAYLVQMVAEGRETSGGTAKGSVSGRLRSLPDAGTEIAIEASVELTGRIMQMGRGMIQSVARQLFQQFAASTKSRLEAPAGSAEAEKTTQEPLRLVPLILQALWSAIVRFFRRLLRRSDA